MCVVTFDSLIRGIPTCDKLHVFSFYVSLLIAMMGM